MRCSASRVQAFWSMNRSSESTQQVRAAERALIVEGRLGRADSRPVEPRRSCDEAELGVQGPDAHRSAHVRRRAGEALDDAGGGIREKAALRILEVGPGVEADVDGLADDGRAAKPGRRRRKHTAAEGQTRDAQVLDGVGVEQQAETGVPVPAEIQTVAGESVAANSRVAALLALRSVGAATQTPGESA